MNPSFKKVINILSYALNVILIIALFGLCRQKGVISKQDNSIESIKEGILQRERADLPLKIQEFDKVYGITVDDFVFTNNIEPYSGYLVTTWDFDEKQDITTKEWAANGYKDKYLRKQKQVFVEIYNVTVSKNREISWQNNWGAAYYSIVGL